MKISVNNNKKIYLIIHGHFYQPPRENPFLNIIEPQESALPFRDWNERISYECYIANAYSRLLDGYGRISKIINNFEYISFNIGPTLMTYLKENFNETYNRIVEADKISCTKNNGHGNAIAQVYNHIIMPLALRKDKTTQIIWGIKDFYSHYNRDPEGMWLSETAVDYETIECLIEQGIKFIILAPSQALTVRNIDGGDWIDVSKSNIRTNQAYRFFLQKEISKRNKYIDIFFYDGTLSSAVSFENILVNAYGFVSRIKESVSKKDKGNQLVNIATDGETYGHHHAFGDMCLAALYDIEVKNHNIIPINYGNYLELYPPEMEVELKPNGTAWSCAHGVGRWKEDCGCSLSNNPDWNQKWRTPLRKAFNKLQNKADIIFDSITKKYLNNIVSARNDYIEIIINGYTDDIKSKFLKKYQKRQLSDEEKAVVWTMFEAQKYTMFMFTSCGWFFDDISGLEPVQNMKYASYVIQLLNHFTDTDLRKLLLDELSTAKSNIEEFGTGKDIYIKNVESSIYDSHRICVHYAVNKIIKPKLYRGNNIYVYTIDNIESKAFIFKGNNVLYEKVQIENKFTNKKDILSYVFVFKNINQFRLFITHDHQNMIQLFQNISGNVNIDELFKGYPKYGLEDIIHYDKEKIFHNRIKQKFKNMDKMFADVLNDNKELFVSAKASRVKLPKNINDIITIAYKNMIFNSINFENFVQYGDKFLKLMDLGRAIGIDISQSEIVNRLENNLNVMVKSLKKDLTIQKCVDIIHFLKICNKFSLKLELRAAQNIVYFIYIAVQSVKKQEYSVTLEKHIAELAQLLNISTE